MSLKTVLTIAGFDPSSGAGITADLAVFAAHGLFGTSCITALTVQSTLGVKSVHPVEARIVTATLDHLTADLPPAGIKIGMLATASIVEAVADFLARRRKLDPNLKIVLDPVLRSSSGRDLLSPEGISLMKQRLLPLVDWITPNLDELAILSGLPVTSTEDMLAASCAMQARYPHLNVLATGGHLDPPDDLVLAQHAEPLWLQGERIESRATHGTGCAFSSSLLCGLVSELSPAEAATTAKHYVAEAIRTATPIGGGHGPMNLNDPDKEGERTLSQ